MTTIWRTSSCSSLSSFSVILLLVLVRQCDIDLADKKEMKTKTAQTREGTKENGNETESNENEEGGSKRKTKRTPSSQFELSRNDGSVSN